MPTFGATLRRKNGKLLERSILGLVSLRRILVRSNMETLGDRPFCRCMDGLLLMWRNDGCTIEAYPAPRSNSGCNSAPYWETSYYYYNITTILSCWKKPERNFVKNLDGISLLAAKF